MRLDAQVCYRALASRDARFDGKFFTGVLTTGIYCRPEASPGTPAWLGTASTVSRAKISKTKRAKPRAERRRPGDRNEPSREP